MKRNKSIMSVIMSLLLIITIFCGCNDFDIEKTTKPTETTTKVQTTEPEVTISSDVKTEAEKTKDEVENGERLTDGQKRFHEATYKRDLALITLMLGTGIRISECVGLNINDIDFETNSFKVTRKGGNEVVLFINDEIARTLEAYLEQRLELQPEEGDEDALLKKRITPRSVQNLVKKYSRIIAPLKKISPHKLRSTYGTALYHETSDIYLVADVLGHRDVNTTKKHYAAMSEDRRREAAGKVKLRRDE